MKKIRTYKKIVQAINTQEENDPLIIVEVTLPKRLELALRSSSNSNTAHKITVYPFSQRVH